MGVDRFPRGQVVGELVPRPACGEDIEDGTHDVVEAVASWGAAVFALALVERFAQDWFPECPLLGRQV